MLQIVLVASSLPFGHGHFGDPHQKSLPSFAPWGSKSQLLHPPEASTNKRPDESCCVSATTPHLVLFCGIPKGQERDLTGAEGNEKPLLVRVITPTFSENTVKIKYLSFKLELRPQDTHPQCYWGRGRR